VGVPVVETRAAGEGWANCRVLSEWHAAPPCTLAHSSECAASKVGWDQATSVAACAIGADSRTVA
jgi:hypothetical protein